MQLDLFGCTQPVVTDNELSNLLRGRGWVTRRILSRETGMNEREIRELASCGPVASGNLGYIHLLDASSDDIEGCIGRLESQAKDMLCRARELKKWIV